MSFNTPLILLLIPVVVFLLFILFINKYKKNKVALTSFIGDSKSHLIPLRSKRIRLFKVVFLFLSVILIIISIARPQKGFIWQDETFTGIDIVIALDTSRSMNAIDVQPDRLTRAKMAILELSQELKTDRIALIPFAGSSFVMTPFTADYKIFNESVMSIDSYTIPKGGTNIKSAIKTAEELFNKNSKNKIMILITDGEDLAKQGLTEAKKVANKGVQIYTVGVGTKEGELIPDPKSQGTYLKDNRGNIVKSRLDENALREISTLTGGDYRHLSSGGNGVLEIYREKLESLEKIEKEEKMSKQPVDKYKWFLFPAVILLIIELLLRNLLKSPSKKSIFSMIFLLSITSIYSTPADNAYKEGDFNKAIELYRKEKESPETLYNLGNSYYKMNLFNNASETYNKSLKMASGKLQKKILYNLGNSYYRESQQADDMNQKIDLLTKSLDSYKGSISLNNNDEQVKKNHDFVEEILNKLKDQQNQDQQNQDQQNQDQQNQDQQNQDQQNRDQQNQDQQNRDQQNRDQQNQDQQNQDQQNQDQQNQDQQNQDQQNRDQQNQDQQNQDQQNQDQQNRDQQNQDQQNQDQQNRETNEQRKGTLTEEEAKALLKSLESEDVKFKILQNNLDNSYTGEW